MSSDLSFQERLARRPLRDVYRGSDDLWSYRAAAATLASFDCEQLLPFRGDPLPTLRTQLLVECDINSADDAAGTRWSLRTSVRQPTLRRLFDNGWLLEALNANTPRDSTPTQLMFERCIQLESPPPSFPVTMEVAAAMLEVSYWLQGIPALWSRIPSRDSIRQFIAREQLLTPFRALVGNHFAGRRSELAALSDYVGVFQSSNIGESFVRTFESIFSISERPPIFVFGPGGSGKSTLIAKFVLDHAENANYAQFPFAYLDFDRTALVAEEPISLLFEVMRQLAAQYPEASGKYKTIVDGWTSRVYAQVAEKEDYTAGASDPISKSLGEEYADEDEPDYLDEDESDPSIEDSAREDSESQRPDSAVSFHRKPELRLEQRDKFLSEFAEFVRPLDIQGGSQPLLLVLDTFEEVQFRSAASEDDIFYFLDQLQKLIPRLRTVICGRAEITSARFKVKKVTLGNFDDAAALSFLIHQGIGEEALAKTIIKQVGTSPLVLRLAADVAAKTNVGSKGIEGLGSRWLERFRAERVEVVLYRRILAHVYDSRIQRLANPGLVLRYITPEVLLSVLAPACGLPMNGLPEARALVKGMSQQLSTILVPSGGADRLAHRPDMRAILLQDLASRADREKSTADALRDIHSRAVDFYARHDDPESRAEEMFHRLSLRQDRATLKQRWRDDAGPYLGSAILELSPVGQNFVAARAGFDISEAVWSEAIEEDWILLAARRIDDLIRIDKLQEACGLLEKRFGRTKLPANLDSPYRGLIESLLSGYARFYERTRKERKAGDTRTKIMEQVVTDVRSLAKKLRLDPSYANLTFARDEAGDRIVGLALAQADPETNINLAITAIGSAISPFEQYHGLHLAGQVSQISESQQAALREALLTPKGAKFQSSDRSRELLREGLLQKWPEMLFDV
jgi:Cdc6-like AAA superfamily ATPase